MRRAPQPLPWITGATTAAVFVIFYILFVRSRPGAGPHAAGSLPSEAPDRRPAVQDGHTSPIESHGAGAFSSQTVDEVAQTAPCQAEHPATGRDAGSSHALVSLLVEWGWENPTAEDIEWLTLTSWNQIEFLELTEQEAHDLLPLDDTIGLKGPMSLLSVIGPLPTVEDCERAMISQNVQDALRETLTWEAVIAEFGLIPLERRELGAEARLQEAIRLRDAAAVELMKRLEEATGYPLWRTWWRLYRRWSE